MRDEKGLGEFLLDGVGLVVIDSLAEDMVDWDRWSVVRDHD